jgi:hypothetical protein
MRKIQYKLTIDIDDKTIEIPASTIEEMANKINGLLKIELVSKYMVANWVNKKRIKAKKYDFININKITT